MSDWQTFVTSNYTFDKNKGYVLDTSRPTPKFLQLSKGINKTFRTLRTSNPFNLTTPSVPRTGEVSQVTGGSSDNKRPTGTTFVDKMKNIPTSSAVTGSSYSITTGKQMQGTLGIADLALGHFRRYTKLLSGLTKSFRNYITRA